MLKTQLPKQNSGKEEVVLKPRTENCNEQSKVLSDLNLLTSEIMNDQNLVLEVPDRLSSRPDPLITSTRNYRDAIKRHDWTRDVRYPDRVDVLNIDVTEESLPRAYRIMDTVIKLLRVRNHEVKVRNDKTVAVIQGEEIVFRLREKSQVIKQGDGYGSREFIPTGNFVFAFGKYSWREKYVADGKQRLETKLAIILAKMELEGKQEHEERIRRERRQKEREEQKRIENEIRERKEAELKKFTDLYKGALQLHHATILRNYIEQLHANSDVGEDWMEWARKKIDWYHPLVKADDHLLEDDHKDIAYKYFMSIWK